VTLPARINFITLACRDMDRMARFYRQFKWPEAPSSEPAHVVFQCSNGVVLGLYGAVHYEPSTGPVVDGFRGFTLAVNCEDMDEVARIYATVQAFDDVHDLEPPRRAHWGGGFSFRDPEGNIWDVAWAEGSRFEANGGIIFP
jgi:uncharacterized protein